MQITRSPRRPPDAETVGEIRAGAGLITRVGAVPKIEESKAESDAQSAADRRSQCFTLSDPPRFGMLPESCGSSLQSCRNVFQSCPSVAMATAHDWNCQSNGLFTLLPLTWRTWGVVDHCRRYVFVPGVVPAR